MRSIRADIRLKPCLKLYKLRAENAPHPGKTERRNSCSALRFGSARAVGRAVGHNLVSLIIPCHRVIGVDESLTDYGAV
ncbi:MGMT family protein [Treponema endosymbiont of Eucomonympha sp.]|uniref:MGMT family protein n=1 Tax=Treponema endosymbiont of Eucomonympha sp. TaxID=1580831 RepID=UPI000AFB9FF5|nr:MGMT family protein [Treponema endosymbiont of Eucomonympha sp.]